MPPRRRPFRWNGGALRYVDSRGRFVPRREVRRAIDYAIGRAEQDVAALTESLRRGDIRLEVWHREMRRMVKDVHLYNVAAARGGWRELTQADYGRIGQEVRRQYRYLDDFAREIASGQIPLTGISVGRAQMYANAGRISYEKYDKALHVARGFTEEHSWLGNTTRHCEECIRQQNAGWSPIGSLVPVGFRQCLSRCDCRMEYR